MGQICATTRPVFIVKLKLIRLFAWLYKTFLSFGCRWIFRRMLHILLHSLQLSVRECVCTCALCVVFDFCAGSTSIRAVSVPMLRASTYGSASVYLPTLPLFLIHATAQALNQKSHQWWDQFHTIARSTSVRTNKAERRIITISTAISLELTDSFKQEEINN